MASGRRSNNNENDLPPPPTMAQVFMAVEGNRANTDRLLEKLVHNSAPRNNTCTTLTEFLRTQPPQFANAKEPLEADDWLRALEPTPLVCGPHGPDLAAITGGVGT